MNDDRIASAGRILDQPEAAPSEPPRIYYLACGAQCDVFWWARRKVAHADSASAEQRIAERD